MGRLNSARVVAALVRALPGRLAASDVERVAVVEQVGAVFITFASTQAAAVAVGLDGCPLPLEENEDDAPIVCVEAHGRKVKSRSQVKGEQQRVQPQPVRTTSTTSTPVCAQERSPLVVVPALTLAPCKGGTSVSLTIRF